MVHPKIQAELNIAARDVKRLREAKTSASARSAWVSFLEHSNRALSKLQRHAERTGQQQQYKQLMTKEIWATELTRYMRSVRHEHEHGVDDVDGDEAHDTRAVFPNGQILGLIPRITGTTADGRTVSAAITAGPAEITATPDIQIVRLKPGIKMIPVVDTRGDTVMPPHVQIHSDDEPEPAAAARLYLKWVTEQIDTFT